MHGCKFALWSVEFAQGQRFKSIHQRVCRFDEPVMELAVPHRGHALEVHFIDFGWRTANANYIKLYPPRLELLTDGDGIGALV